MADGYYTEANTIRIDDFQRLKDVTCLEIRHAGRVEAGRCPMRLEQYDDAIFAYENSKASPRNEAILHVITRSAGALTASPPRIGTRPARKALETFQRLTGHIPGTPMPAAPRSYRGMLQTCPATTSASGCLPSPALQPPIRFRTVTEYRFGYHQPALEYIVRSEKKLAEESVQDKEVPDAPARDEPGSG
jgi:hypothetical protein